MSEQPIEKSELIQRMLEAVQIASVATEGRRRRFTQNITTKPNETLAGKKDYITEIDTFNQNVIFDFLKRKYPETHLYGEELGQDHAKSDPQEGDRQWVLDPIDSTRNLVAGTSDFSISLGCQEFHAGKWVTIAGVVDLPGKHNTVWAEKGKGAFIIDKTHNREEKVQLVQHHKTGAEAFDARAVELLLVKEGECLEPSVWQQLHKVDRRVIRMIDSGAAALAMMGTDRHGVITGGLTDYDKTAGLLIAQEAGAELAEYDLPYIPNERDSQQPSRHAIHVVAADVEMLVEMCKITERALTEKGIPIVPVNTITGERMLQESKETGLGRQ